jgi:hypothetical protein
LPNQSLSVGQVLALLEETPRRIAEVTRSLGPAELRRAPEDDAWSANHVLAHLRACADQWGGCMVAMIAVDSPTLKAVNPLTWITQTDYLELEFKPSLRAFAAQRAELLATLRPMPPEGWLRSATVTGAGAPLQRTVLFYGRWLAGHERSHVKQIQRVADGLRGSR